MFAGGGQIGEKPRGGEHRGFGYALLGCCERHNPTSLALMK